MVDSIIRRVEIDFYSDDFDPCVLPSESLPILTCRFFRVCLRFNSYLHKVLNTAAENDRNFKTKRLRPKLGLPLPTLIQFFQSLLSTCGKLECRRELMRRSAADSQCECLMRLFYARLRWEMLL